MIDGNVIKAHQHAAGARRFEEKAIGKSVAGNTLKIHMIVNSYGNPIDKVENVFPGLKNQCVARRPQYALLS